MKKEIRHHVTFLNYYTWWQLLSEVRFQECLEDCLMWKNTLEVWNLQVFFCFFFIFLTYCIIWRGLESPVRASFAAPCCQLLISLGAMSSPSLGRDADFTSLQFPESNKKKKKKQQEVLLLRQQLFLIHGCMLLSAVQTQELSYPTWLYFSLSDQLCTCLSGSSMTLEKGMLGWRPPLSRCSQCWRLAQFQQFQLYLQQSQLLLLPQISHFLDFQVSDAFVLADSTKWGQF